MPDPISNSVHQYPWKPVKHTVIKDVELQEVVHTKGYAVKDWLTETQVSDLKFLFSDLHELAIKDGGIFYSVYSSDLDYRKKVHEEAAEILKPVLDLHLQNYTNIINTFVAKTPGPNSEFYVHQDTSALDESKFSGLSVWIPLVDVGPENGGLSVIEKTHWLYSPHRAVTIPFPFHDYMDDVRSYLTPISMKAGQVLVFDPRIIHSSGVNHSGEDRVALIAGIFPEAAKFQHYFRDESGPEKLDVYEQNDNFMLEFPNFFYDCHIRPTMGEIVRTIDHDFPNVTKEMFQTFCNENGIERPNVMSDLSRSPINLVAEPDGINKPPECATDASEVVESTGVWVMLKRLFD